MITAVFRVMWLNLLRDRGALAMATILPPAIFVIFAAIFSGTSGDDLELRIVLLDRVGSDESRELIAGLTEDAVLRADVLPTSTSVDRVRDRVRDGSADAAVVIRQSLTRVDDDQAPILIIADDSRAIAGAVVGGRVQAALAERVPEVEVRRRLSQVEDLIGPYTAEQRQRLGAAAGEAPEGSGLLSLESLSGQGGAVGGVNYYAGAVAMLFLLFSAMQGAATVIEERRSGIVDRLLMGPGGQRVILAGKWLFLALQGTVQVSLIFTVAWLGYGVDLPGNFAGWLMTTLMAAGACGGLALALTSVCTTRQQAQTLSSFAVLILSAIGGSMVPRFLMPGWLQDLGWMTPNAWAIEAYQGVFWRGEGVSELALHWGVLGLLAVGGLLVAIGMSRRLSGG